jgi:ABC-2 type transport system permease protein
MIRSATLRALPTLARIGFAEALAYRAELLIWVLSTSMPLIMLALWTAVAADAPIGRFDQPQFVAYFLATFVVRQLNSSWIAWQLNHEIRSGALSMRLLRPLHPLVGYLIDSLSALPLRGLVAIPAGAILLVSLAGDRLTTEPLLWLLWIFSVCGGWLVSFAAGCLMGCIAFWTGSSAKVMEAWLAMFFVFSGYTIPIELFPPLLRGIADLLPFRYMIGLPVELMTATWDVPGALAMLGAQWLWVLVLGAAALVAWHRGVARYAAFGG